MEPRTQQHLARAERNRAIAHELLKPSSLVGIQPPPWEWVAVVAFYSAVHYVNAYFWEKLRWDPGGHDARAQQVARSADLRRAAPAYDRLADKGFHARHTPTFRVTDADAQNLVGTDLEAVRHAVLNGLGISP